MNSREFVQNLQEANDKILDRLKPGTDIRSDPGGPFSIPQLLKIALKNEIEATELAAMWMPSTPHIDVKMALARQVGDEAKHYRLIEDRLHQLGEPLDGFNPLADGYTQLFKYLAMLQDTVERVAAAQFTREYIALVKNEQFIELCESRGDTGTSRLYREIIQPDEKHHHELGRRLLEKYAVTEELQASARLSSRHTLEVAEELQGLAHKNLGIHHAPGC